ncbi:hypothetical protein JK164_04420 [Gluconobacter kondonii]|uniref:hypothetical protein n=1 Tax=Gluconobacter kondonii TaxID=941463 RepID=UPI001B8D0C83|nr:hypothetical protein [Gluconobacter kondonii]MBS1065218.1 hypothetical protein [Gluconobacter kondonii]
MGRRRSPSSAPLFETLPQSRRPRPKNPLPRASVPPTDQPDLLGWTPPLTHLDADEVEACLLNPVGFRPPSGEAFVYHLTDIVSARMIVENGLLLTESLKFRTAAHLAQDLADAPVTEDLGIVRVRRRLIQPWLTADRQDGRLCYVLGPEIS